MAWSRDLRRLDRAAVLGAACCLMLAPGQAPAQQDAPPASKAASEPVRKPAKAPQARRVPRKAPDKTDSNLPERSAERSGSRAPAKPIGVAQLCGGKGYWAREWCETKACFRSENQSDAVCRSRNEQRPVNPP